MKVNINHHHVSPTPRWEILQGYHLIMHQALDVVHVYLNMFGPLYLHWISVNISCTFIITPNECG